MVIVYTAANGLEAHMIKGLLEQYEIPAYIQGEHLQSGVGLLHAISDLVKISVDDVNQAEAKKIIKEWEANEASNNKNENDTKSKLPEEISHPSTNYLALIASFVAGAILMHYYLQSPVTHEGIDFNNDGKLDTTYTYKNNLLSKTEKDRNLDGKIDAIIIYNDNGLVESQKTDENFDGDFESEFLYENGINNYSRADLNNDGKFDLVIEYSMDKPKYQKTIYDFNTNLIRKVQKYSMDKLISAEWNSNGDGIMDELIKYNEFEEEVSREKIKH